jgi:hypothetical protein
MSRNKKTSQDRMVLRERLEWLLPTILAGRYPVHTGAGELAVAYCAATGMPTYPHGGLIRSRDLTKDLAELHERRYLSRETITLRQGGRVAVVFKYDLTPRGKAEAQAIIARRDQQSEKTEA